MGTSDEYRDDRLAAATCSAEGDDNCRHEWNALHPDDPVTEEEQQTWEHAVIAALRDRAGAIDD